MKLVIAVIYSTIAFLALATVATAAGNNPSLCAKDEWQNVYRADGSSFASRTDCVLYARGNTIYGGKITATYGTLICSITVCFWNVRITGVGLQPDSFVFTNAVGDGSVFVPLYKVNADGTVAGGCGCDVTVPSFTVTATDRFGNTLTTTATRPA